MKLCAHAILSLLATATLSVAIDARDSSPLAKTITTTIANVQDSIENLTTAAKAFDGQNVDPIINASNSLIQIITNGILKPDGAKLSLIEALALQTPVMNLRSKAQSLLDTFKSGLEQIKMAKACEKTRSQLGEISDKGEALIDSIVGKVPNGFAQKIAANQAAPITQLLKEAESVFAEGSCKDST